MCLGIVTNATEARTASGVGWKVFRELEGQLSSEHFPDGKFYAINYWYEVYALTQNDKRPNYRGQPYSRGFHIFQTEKAAKRWSMGGWNLTVKKVKWRHRLARGTQQNFSVIVTKEMLILP